jgi:predicted transposase YbfD/YdcC
MLNVAHHTIHLQDGTVCNFKKRLLTHKKTLLQAFETVRDCRGTFGKRHQLSFMLVLLFSGITSGSTTLKDCHLWALHNRQFLKHYASLVHGIPDPTTISRAIQKIDMDSLVGAYTLWQEIIYGRGKTASFDGKTMNGMHGENVIRHVLSLFVHETHQAIGQIGVTQKENEIPAAKRLFQQVGKKTLSGMLLIGDALHTQTETAKAIIVHKADYLFVVKENQEQLQKDLALLFTDGSFQTTSATEEEYGHHRYIQTEVELITDDYVREYFAVWKNLFYVGRLKRKGTRMDKGVETPVDETVYFITSKKDLTAKDSAKHLRMHWSIENNLHWQKDYTFLEDRHTLRKGYAPLVMTFLRSMCISLFAACSFASVTTTIANFQKSPSLHHSFLTSANIL